MKKFKELNMMLPFLSPDSQAQLETIEPKENVDGEANVTLGEDPSESLLAAPQQEVME